ncbi:IS4 family transposase, partial [Microcoleus sp. Pol12A6]
APENRDLDIVKAQRKPNVKLIVAPFLDRQRGSDCFFFEASSQIPLTTAIQA